MSGDGSGYVDSCVFLAYINDEPERADVVENLLARAASGDLVLSTSVLSIAEVYYAVAEAEELSLPAQPDQRIADLFDDRAVLQLVELSTVVATAAHALLRRSRSLPRASPTVPDAIHLATAEYVGAEEFLTYDAPLIALAQRLGLPFTASAPSYPEGAQASLLP